MMLGIEVHQTRESCFSKSEGPLGAFLQIPSVFSCVFTEERIEFGHTAIKPRSVECCSDLCPSVSHHTNQSPSPSIAQFGQEASSRKNPGCFKLLLLRVTETTCICDPSMKQNFFLNSSPDVWLDTNLFLSSTDSSFDLRACFLL